MKPDDGDDGVQHSDRHQDHGHPLAPAAQKLRDDGGAFGPAASEGTFSRGNSIEHAGLAGADGVFSADRRLPRQGGSGAGFYRRDRDLPATSFRPGQAPAGSSRPFSQNLPLYSMRHHLAATGSRPTRSNLNGTMVGTGLGGASVLKRPARKAARRAQRSTTYRLANSLNLFGQSQSPDNHQPSLGITYEIAVQGAFPTQQGSLSPRHHRHDHGLRRKLQPRRLRGRQGQILQISQNTALFAILGTFYGGDGTPSRFRTCAGATSSAPRLRTDRSGRAGNMTLTNGQIPGLGGPVTPSTASSRRWRWSI